MVEVYRWFARLCYGFGKVPIGCVNILTVLKKSGNKMSAKYDAGLYDANDLAEAYSDGFKSAKQTVMIVVTTVCPICMEPLVITKHPLCSLPLIVHSGVRWCIKCETEVPAMIRIA